MAIVIVLAIETDIHGYHDRTGLETNMAIVTVLAIETDIHGYCNRPGHQNQYLSFRN